MLIFKYLPFLTINEMYKHLQESWKYRKIWTKKKARKEWLYVTDFPLSAFRVVSSCLLSCIFFKSGIHIFTIILYLKNYFSMMTSTLLKKNWKHTCDMHRHAQIFLNTERATKPYRVWCHSLSSKVTCLGHDIPCPLGNYITWLYHTYYLRKW